MIIPLTLLQNQLAEILLSLGDTSSAVDIYEQLKMWEQAIACYQRLGKSEKVCNLFNVFSEEMHLRG